MNKISVFKDELDWIVNDNIRKFAEYAIDNLPDYFFEVAASSSGRYHPPYALGSGGLVRHTKAALIIAKDLAALEMFKKFSEEDKDLIYVAIMLHDGWKHGEAYNKHTVAEHPKVAAKYVERVNDSIEMLTDEQIEKLSGMIASHMGEFCFDRYKNEILPKPKNSIQWFVHLADYLASRRYLLMDFGDKEYKPENF